MKLTHLNKQGKARMVDIGEKKASRRFASAEGKLRISPSTRQAILEASLPKGNPFEVARIAGIQAAKETSRLIPLCHSIQLDYANVEIELNHDHFLIRSEVCCRWATGVEMEALTAVTIAALCLYDMCKAVDKSMSLEEIRLLEKRKEAI